MRMRVCKRCGDMMSLQNDLCSECDYKMHEVFLQVKEYLREHEGADAIQIATELSLDEADVLYLVDNHWLEREEQTPQGAARCMVCGRRADEGERMCKACKSSTQRSLEAAKRSLSAEAQARSKPAASNYSMNVRRRHDNQ